MDMKELKAYMPEITRVFRILVLLVFAFDYPIVGKYMLLLVGVELAVGRGRYSKPIATILDIILVYLTLWRGTGYFKVNVFMYFCMILLVMQLVLKLGGIALEKFELLKESEKFTGYIEVKVRYIVLAIVIFIAAVFTLAITPYKEAPVVSDAYKGVFNVENFYSNEESCDRAAVIDDNGEALAYRIKLIENAKTDIIMSTFNFKSDTSGKQMIASLVSAAQRGVNVKILLDGFNSLFDVEGNPYFMVLARQENVEIKIYNEASVFTSWKGMSRMHDKYIIADDEVYILGGEKYIRLFPWKSTRL